MSQTDFKFINSNLFSQNEHLNFNEYLIYCYKNSTYLYSSDNVIKNKIFKHLVENYQFNIKYELHLPNIINIYKLDYCNNEDLIEDLNLENKKDYIIDDKRIYITFQTLKKILFFSSKIDTLIKNYICDFYLFLDMCIIEYSNYINFYNIHDYFTVQDKFKTFNIEFDKKLNQVNKQFNEKMNRIENMLSIIENPESEFVKYIKHVNNYNKDYIQKNTKELSNNIYKLIKNLDINYYKHLDLINQIPKNKIMIADNFDKELSEKLIIFNTKLDNMLNEKIQNIQSQFSKIAFEAFKQYLNESNNI